MKTKKGFTLLELLVVVLIIGILAAVALPQYQKSVQRSRNAQLKAVLNALYQAEKNYFLANGQYSYNFDELAVDLPLSKVETTPGGKENICKLQVLGKDSVRRGKDFQVVLHTGYDPTRATVMAQFTSGKYKCVGFFKPVDTNDTLCGFFVSDTSVSYTPQYVEEFCQKLEKGTFGWGTDRDKRWKLP